MMIVTDEQVKQQWYDSLTDEYDLEAIVLAQYHKLCTNGTEADYDEAQNDLQYDYSVYTDEEADEAVHEHIERDVWAFAPSFLSAHTGVDEEVFVALADRCEANNDSFKRMIKDFDHFVNDAVKCDGRGHFLAPYDREENEITFNGITYYIYRRN
tara:strand:+ start:771 stop:1235 length:465 start_codon:yes stop_codon:yes gene_type:complete